MREKSLGVIQAFKVRVVSRPVEAVDLADEYVKRGMIPGRYRPDAEHIAVASVTGFEVLVSWNLTHIVKFKKRRWFEL